MKKFNRWMIVIGMFLLLGTNTGAQNHQDSIEQAYRQNIDSWHKKRIENLQRSHGWLSLIALDWLKYGTNEMPSIGTITIDGGRAEVKILPELQATINGKPFSSGFIHTDADTTGPDKIVLGTRAFTIIKRGDRYAVRMWDSDALARKNFTGIERYPVSLQWRIQAKWQSYKQPKKIHVASVIPEVVEESMVPGVAIFILDGKEFRLEPIGEEGEKELFFLFADKTNGSETYGAGRFLYSNLPQGDTVILDFNKAYNPPCAFSLYATCPLPPPENRLNVRIEAGEKKYGQH